VKAGPRDRNLAETSAAAFTPAVILFIALPEAEDKIDPGMTVFPLGMLPRRCPLCGNPTIIGHGQHRKQAHDQVHDVIYVRRGLCRPCRKTFTVLPTWSVPNSHYSLHCRRQAAERIEQPHGTLEQSAPIVRDPDRLPDPSTLRRWAARRLISVWFSLQAGLWKVLGWSFFRVPTILTWDFPAACRILRLEASTP
jgi:hypothetical protein